jgi:hypothetical protein
MYVIFRNGREFPNIAVIEELYVRLLLLSRQTWSGFLGRAASDSSRTC